MICVHYFMTNIVSIESAISKHCFPKPKQLPIMTWPIQCDAKTIYIKHITVCISSGLF